MKPPLMLTLLMLGMSLGHEAQAFYNPNTGRWLNRDPILEVGHRVLDSVNWAKQEKPKASPSTYGMSRCNSKSCTDGYALFQSPTKQGGDRFEFQFCQNDPLNLIDVDGRKVPLLVCQYYVLQGVVGVVGGILEKLVIKRQCEALAETPGQEAFGSTPVSSLLTIANVAIIVAHCGPCGGRVYAHVWFDEELNCKWDYVIICNGCPSA